SLMDSATFMSFIDRVGKFQLEMQHHFLYGPMALSMPWMRFLEESYHLAAGETLMKAIAVAGILDGGNFGIEDLQQTLNMWYPRGLEMFGSELGGDLVKGVFKTLKNGEAQTIYIDEVRGKVRDVNVAIIQAKARCNRKEAEAILRRLTEKGEDGHGLSKDDLVFLPDRRFFRIRGLAEFSDYRMAGSDAAGVGYVYLPYDVHGHVLTEGGKPIDRAAYVDYLRNVLPDRYMRSRHWDFVKEEFLFNEKWGTPEISRHGCRASVYYSRAPCNGRGRAMDLTYISLEKRDRVAVAWMNKPKANTYDADLMRDLNTMIDDVRFDDDIDVCVLASKLDGIWSAGADINLLASSTPDYKATGRMITPKDALDWGLFNRVFPRAKFWDETMAFAKGLAYPQHSGRAVGLIKRSVTEGTEMPMYEGLALERELQNRLFAMADAKEGFRAFLEKRKPAFQRK